MLAGGAASSSAGCHNICAFFGSFGFFVQAVLAVLSFSALIFKVTELPRLHICTNQMLSKSSGFFQKKTISIC
jgi:hypothetical protein